ncbi:unnamed protein product [Rotaria sp. Silwood2]|nr:unnamed protein product [Rotaria sp. Silwood2]CAF3067468.1 unnamed protein product [Rotaria sp. Silwood2]CAF4551858.1 unnamed protein product [Rotaria sp. Silwood2]CAF4560329.1 unnamed protein product [Rotaria sp. Silwood2]CAF4639840.1 unnamed protein product [Rotaria sp. Silwood2]
MDFREIFFSPAVNFLKPIRLTVLPNLGCDDDDWQHATPYPAIDSVVLVMHDKNNCSVVEKSSGARATLVLALNLAHLFQASSYEKHLYRIRCGWWGAEENSMLGSYHHVNEANITIVEGNRLKDYVLVLNFDMLASFNFYCGTYEPTSLPDKISSKVKNASDRISQLFRHWFDKEGLPWDNSSPILSDYVPFLFADVPCGGIFSGAGSIKTLEQRNRYDIMLGHGYGGI